MADDDLEARDVTPQVDSGAIDGEHLQIKRCVCGAEHDAAASQEWVSIYDDLARPMPCCGALLIFTHTVSVLELVEAGAPITQPPDDHPIWQLPVAEAGPLTVTLRHMRDSTIEAGGRFEIHGYSADGNPLVDAAGAGDDTLDEIVGQEQEESGP